jgi:predicted nucleic acid-binding Zn ribbon protein
MPIFEGYCENSSCGRSGELFEYLLRSSDSPDPECPGCGISVSRTWSTPSICWAKDLGQYFGRNDEGHYAHWTDEKGQPQKTFIRTREQQKTFCKDHGYRDPNDLNDKPTQVAKTEPTGQKGSWI